MRVRDHSHRLLTTDAPAATLLVRWLVGAVFLVEGVQKFLDPTGLGAGRFAKIGIPAPDVLGPFVATVETVGGALLLLGLLTRPAALALLVDITVALLATKLPILAGRDLGPFHVATLARYGFWSMAHEARTDWAMLCGSLFLLIVGAGAWSLDARLANGRRAEGRRSEGPLSERGQPDGRHAAPRRRASG